MFISLLYAFLSVSVCVCVCVMCLLDSFTSPAFTARE